MFKMHLNEAQRHALIFGFFGALLNMTGCETQSSADVDMEIPFTPAPIDAGSDRDGELAGTPVGGEPAGDDAGVESHDMSRVETGVDLALNDWGSDGMLEDASTASCGDELCDPNASCVSTPEGEMMCECVPMYEGDGTQCTLQPCPPNASGAPSCRCDEGYEGELYYEVSTRAWQGSCIPCALKMLPQERFISVESDGVEPPELPGQMLYSDCIEANGAVTRAKYSWSEGDIYVWQAHDDQVTTCAPEDTSSHEHVDFWPYSGGVLSESYLYHVDGVSVREQSCDYNFLIVKDTDQLARAYLAPAGRSCSEGAQEPVSCGTGVCRADGSVVCQADEWVDDCQPLTPQEGLDLCDLIDSDCDGEIDEDFESEQTQCGTGVCAAMGVTSCELGRLIDSCLEGDPVGPDLTCDGRDEDCDGSVDEGYITQPTSCGTGVCQAEGAIRCEDGIEVTYCDTAPTTGEDNDCDLIDQDCDGRVDEAYQESAVSCGVGACLSDGLTRCINGVPEDVCTPRSPADDDDLCDGVDEDCDERVDEDVADTPISCGRGACSAAGVRTCLDGELREICEALAPLDDDQNCDGIDGDCDGAIDEHFESEPVVCSGAGTYSCSVSVQTRCVDGILQIDCDQALNAITDDTCDGDDDDCDGVLDESYAPVAVSCGIGACANTAMTRCIEGEIIDQCLTREPTGDDADCDGRDDDCDGSVDESFVSYEVTCGDGLCVATGQARCEDGVTVSDCQPTLPTDPDESVCDGVDDDCDGRVDERFSSTRTACGDGVCASIGSSSCSDGVFATNCIPLNPTGDDAECDGIDQDCDARTDESYPSVIDECGVGVCYNTAPSSCVNGAVQNNCDPLPEQGDDSLCDGIDQDCDGRIDEAYQPVQTTCTYGSACVQDGLTACVNGQILEVCEPPVFYTGEDNSCNLEDNDCDGSLDEGFVGGVFYCGAGVCRGSGFRSCVNGQEAGGDCTPNSNLASSDANCNGSDDDCDGRTDEHYGTYNVTCGRGVCARGGIERCSGGSVVNTCTPGAPRGNDNDTNGQDDDCDGRVDEASIPPETNCNGADDDFDGRIDEGYGVTNTTCGVGACARTGTRYCENGSVIDTCVPGGSIDNDCDSVDEDCDGRVDEHYSGGGTTCGRGACARNGAFVCISGSISDTCVEGQPGNEVLNNNVDDDCDGTTDEGQPPREPVGSVLYRCDLAGGNWYTRQLVSSGWLFYSAGLVCYRSGGFIYDATGYTFIDGTARAPGTGECVNACR